MQRGLLFLLGIFSFSTMAIASGPTCASIFGAAPTAQAQTAQQASQPVFTVNFQELGMQQSFVSLRMQFAESTKSNREFNEAMVEVTQVLNRMFDRYLLTIRFAQTQMNAGNKDLLVGFMKQNQDFFTSFLGHPPEVLKQFLQSRATALSLIEQGNPAAMGSIGFIQNPAQASGTPPMGSIGFIQNPQQGQGARPLASIGFIQPSEGNNAQAPANKLPTIGFVQPKASTGGNSNYQPSKADVGYRLAIVFNLEFGVFEVQRPEAR